MFEEDWNHCRIVQSSLVGKRAVDEQTFASLTILAERLKRLRKLGGMFSGVTFSDAIKKRAGQKKAMAIS